MMQINLCSKSFEPKKCCEERRSEAGKGRGEDAGKFCLWAVGQGQGEGPGLKGYFRFLRTKRKEVGRGEESARKAGPGRGSSGH